MRAASLQKLHRAVDRHAAERVSIQPMQAGGYLAPQAAGAPAEALAYLATTSGPVRTEGFGANSGANVDLAGSSHTAKLSTSALPFPVETGFTLTRLDEPGQPVYRVAGVYPFGTDRTILTLSVLPQAASE